MSIRRTPSFFAVLLLFVVLFVAFESLPIGGRNLCLAASEAPQRIRWLVSAPPFSPQLERELTAIVREFNQISSKAEVEVHLRGDDYSTLRELSVASLAGSLPDIATLEPSESDALNSLSLSRPKALPEIKSLNLNPIYFEKSHPEFIPFFRTLPVLVIDQEILVRIGVDPKQLPGDWSSFLQLTQKLIQSGAALDDSQGQFALALSLTGARGLFALEALLAKPLWIYESKKIVIPSTLTSNLEQIRALFRSPRRAKSGLGWEQAIQAFLERKSPLLVTTTDALPMISGRSTFRWTAVPLPQVKGGNSRLATGADVVVLKNSPALWEFLRYLYSPRVASRWTTAGGLLPLHSSWIQSAEWKHAAEAQESLLTLLRDFTTSPVRIEIRSSCQEIMRIRSQWIAELPLFWQDPTEKSPSAGILARIGAALH